MTVYVDKASSAYSRDGVHRMLADTVDELHCMAARIGCPYARYESLYDWYVVTHRMRFTAIQHGAKVVSVDIANAMVELRRLTGLLAAPEVAQVFLDSRTART